jgi:tRNA (cmo5U34)-methyltransferase
MSDTGFNAERAKGYDERIEQMLPGYTLMQRLTAIYLGTEIPESARVLIVGAGTGAELVECGSRHPNWRFTAVDPSPAMLKIAREKTDAAGISAQVTWHEQSLKKLKVDEPFDAAAMLLVLHFLPDDGGKAALLEHIAGRLKPGAPLVLSTFVGDPANTRTKKIYELARTYAIANGVARAEAEEKMNLARTDVHLVPEERIKALLRDTGFIDVQRVLQGLAMTMWIARTAR